MKIAKQQGVKMIHGPYMILSALLFTAQRREMLSATMETGGSPSRLSWNQVNPLWWVVTGWAGAGGGLLLWGHLCTFLRLSLCLISLLRLSVLLGHLCTLRPIAACGEHLVHISGCLKLRSPFPQGRAHDCPERIGN